MTSRLPPCGSKGLVHPTDIQEGLVTVRSLIWIAQTRNGRWDFWTDFTPEQRANAEVQPRADGQPIGPEDLGVQEFCIGQYLAGAIDTFPVCSWQGPPSRGYSGLWLLLGAVLLAVLASRSKSG